MRLQTERYLGRDIIGLPNSERCVVISNSERTMSACPRKWWFLQAERLRPRAKRRPLSFGIGWDLLMEDRAAWFMVHDTEYLGDGFHCVWCCGQGGGYEEPTEGSPGGPWTCDECGGSGWGPLRRIHERWLQERRDALSEFGGDESYTQPLEDIEDIKEALKRAFEGYAYTYGNAPHRFYRVVGVKLQISRPILNPRTGNPYLGTMHIIELDDGRMRLAQTGEALQPPVGSRTRAVRWPWYQIGELDALLQDRNTGALFVTDFKSSTGPRHYLESSQVDPQITGYSWMLERVVREGRMVEPSANCVGGIKPETRIGGYLYDVTSSSMQRDPKSLKEPKGGWKPGKTKLSVAKNGGAPSWRFVNAIKAIGDDPKLYAEHLRWLERFHDPKLYVTEPAMIGPVERGAYGIEIYGVAREHSRLWRKAATCTDAIDVEMRFPRRAICRMPGGSCAFTGPCLQDGPEARTYYRQAEPLEWQRSDDAEQGE